MVPEDIVPGNPRGKVKWALPVKNVDNPTIIRDRRGAFSPEVTIFGPVFPILRSYVLTTIFLSCRVNGGRRQTSKFMPRQIVHSLRIQIFLKSGTLRGYNREPLVKDVFWVVLFLHSLESRVVSSKYKFRFVNCLVCRFRILRKCLSGYVWIESRE